METWEQARIDRLEHRVQQLERKSWERADFTFRLIMYGLTAAVVVLNIVTIAIAASNPGH
jgi:quinol-cytochrome oxidoreductase complex cytochrome b subunit